MLTSKSVFMPDESMLDSKNIQLTDPATKDDLYNKSINIQERFDRALLKFDSALQRIKFFSSEIDNRIQKPDA